MSMGRAGYRVVAAMERERRRRAAARARLRRAQKDARRVQRMVEAARQVYGDLDVPAASAPEVGDDAPAAEYEAATTATRAAAARARERLDTALQLARARAMVTPTVELRSHGLADDAARAQAERRMARRVAERRGLVQPVLALLPAEASDDEVRRARTVADEALSAGDEGGFARSLDRLQMVVQTARDRDRQRRDRLAQVDRWRAELDGFDDDRVAEVRRRLDEVDPKDPLPPHLGTAVARAARAARDDQDRDFTLDAIARTLTELGYVVEGDFASAVREGRAVASLPDERHHALEVSERDGVLDFDVVRYEDAGPEDPVADQQAEQRWCADHDRVREVAQEHGVELEFGELVPPGSRPVRRVGRSRRGEARRDARRDRRDKRAAARERSR